jgi:O-methyltransferase involved in polyketide biosynthesis
MPDPFDPDTPSIARMWDFWLGGSEWLPADEAAAREFEALNPDAPRVARTDRDFLGRAVNYAARQGIGQFLDLGAGLPTNLNTHDAARAVLPDARVAYVDNDAVAHSHADALLADDGVTAVLGDLSDPSAILASEAVRSVIRLAEPVCVILGSVLHFFPVEQAREIAAAYIRAAAPGSIVVISTVRTDDEDLWPRIHELAVRAAGFLVNLTVLEVRSLFRGLEMIPPGVVPARAWRGGMEDPGLSPAGRAYVLGGAGRKPYR